MERWHLSCSASESEGFVPTGPGQTILGSSLTESLLHLAPQELSARSCELIRHYVQQAQPGLATSIAAHLEALYLRPDFKLSVDESCHYRRALRHWQWLAMRSQSGDGQGICPGV